MDPHITLNLSQVSKELSDILTGLSEYCYANSEHIFTEEELLTRLLRAKHILDFSRNMLLEEK